MKALTLMRSDEMQHARREAQAKYGNDGMDWRDTLLLHIAAQVAELTKTVKDLDHRVGP